MINNIRPMPTEDCVTVVCYDEQQKIRFERGFKEAKDAYLFMMRYWSEHPNYYMQLYLSHWDWVYEQKRRRMWLKRTGFSY